MRTAKLLPFALTLGLLPVMAHPAPVDAPRRNLEGSIAASPIRSVVSEWVITDIAYPSDINYIRIPKGRVPVQLVPPQDSDFTTQPIFFEEANKPPVGLFLSTAGNTSIESWRYPLNGGDIVNGNGVAVQDFANIQNLPSTMRIPEGEFPFLMPANVAKPTAAHIEKKPDEKEWILLLEVNYTATDGRKGTEFYIIDGLRSKESTGYIPGDSRAIFHRRVNPIPTIYAARGFENPSILEFYDVSVYDNGRKAISSHPFSAVLLEESPLRQYFANEGGFTDNARVEGAILKVPFLGRPTLVPNEGNKATTWGELKRRSLVFDTASTWSQYKR